MKNSKEKEHRISNLKDMIDNVKDDENTARPGFEEIEEDSELIEYLNEDSLDYDELEIDDEYLYHPGDETSNAINLEENPIDEDYIIKTPKTEDIEDNEDIGEDFDDELLGEISENFDNVVNAKVRGRPILAIVSSILGVVFLIISAYIFQSRSDRVIDNVVAGESNFMFVIFFIAGLFLLVYGIFKIFKIKNPFENITSRIDSIENDDEKNDAAKTEKPSPKVLPKSEIPLDRESYKIGEFDMDDIKSSLKKPTASKKGEEHETENAEDLPHAKEKSPKNDVVEEEHTQKDYEKAKLKNESIDDIFAEVEDLEDIPIISSDEKK